MEVQIRWSEVDKSDALAAHIDAQVEHAVRHHADRLTHVEVHVHDDNGHKGGTDDKRVLIEARPRGADPLVVEATGADYYVTVTAAAKKLERVVTDFVERRRG